MLGINCCCQGDCPGFCADATNVNILVDLSGWADDAAVPVPPDIGTCDTCDELNQTYLLTFVPAGVVDIPFSGCATTDENSGILPCFYSYRLSCGSEAIDNNLFGRVLDVSLRVYVTTGGDRRGYLQVYYTTNYTTLMGSDGRFQVLGDDFLIESGSSSTDCLTFTRTGTFSQTCANTVGVNYDCTPPTDYSISVVEA